MGMFTRDVDREIVKLCAGADVNYGFDQWLILLRGRGLVLCTKKICVRITGAYP